MIFNTPLKNRSKLLKLIITEYREKSEDLAIWIIKNTIEDLTIFEFEDLINV